MLRTCTQDIHAAPFTRVGNRGLRHLGGLSRFEVIDLQATDGTEEGLEPLWALPRGLRRLEGAGKVRISQGQRRTIIASTGARNGRETS